VESGNPGTWISIGHNKHGLNVVVRGHRAFYVEGNWNRVPVLSNLRSAQADFAGLGFSTACKGFNNVFGRLPFGEAGPTVGPAMITAVAPAPRPRACRRVTRMVAAFIIIL